MELSEVKNVIVSILNLEPKGIYADKLNHEYKKIEGCNIPFSSFGYSSLLKFLEYELKDNIRIDDGNDWNIMLYPIGNEKSGHILKLKAESNETKKSRKRNHNGRQPSQPIRVPEQVQPQTPRVRQLQPLNVSPTMPALVLYKPFMKQNANNSTATGNICNNAYARDRLIQSHKAYLARIRPAAAQQRTPSKQSQTKSSQTSHDSPRRRRQQPQINGTANIQTNTCSPNQSDQSIMIPRMAAMKLQDGGVQTKSEPTPSTSKFQENIQTTNTAKGTPIQVSKVSDDFDDLWDDELENVQPPTISRSNPSSFYGVSDTSNHSTASKSSHELLVKRMLESSSEDEAKISEIPDLLNEFQAGDFLPAYVSETNNPLKFWIHIRQEKYIMQINEMHKKMQEFYTLNKNAEEFKIKGLDEVDGGYFAAEFNQQWHRVEPYDTRMGEAIRISFIDYGSREILNVNKLRRLDKQFWKTPKAAVCCGLGNIKPIGPTFSTSSANQFIELVEDQKVFAKILHIDTSKSKAIVELILNKDKMCVNDEMVKLGHATQKPLRANA